MKLIITRPKADAERLAPQLLALGHTPLICPLMEIKHHPRPVLPELELQAVCASSANGLDARLDWSTLTGLPFYAVGPQSADAANARGFRTVHTSTGGNLKSLVDLIASNASSEGGPVLYLSGSEVSGDLADLLRPHGIDVERIIVYDVCATRPMNLPAAIAAADGVLLYSSRAAELWRKAIGEADVGSLRHFCLSANVAARLPQSTAIFIASTPDDKGMMQLLDWRDEPE